MKRTKNRALLLPWLIAATVGAAVLAGAAATRNHDAKSDDVPPLEVIPELVVVEPYDPDGDPNAP